jgi:uncharacterized damage-inducible protein DinB
MTPAPSPKSSTLSLMRHFERLFAYDEWANREVVTQMKGAAPSPRTLRLMNHVVAAELVWLARLERQSPPLPVWPDLPLAECEAQVRALPSKWRDWFADLEPADLDATIDYVNTKGAKFTSRVDDVLTHVTLHSAYHRGQIAADVRAGGKDPAYTDFIHCARSGFIDGE